MKRSWLKLTETSAPKMTGTMKDSSFRPLRNRHHRATGTRLNPSIKKKNSEQLLLGVESVKLLQNQTSQAIKNVTKYILNLKLGLLGL